MEGHTRWVGSVAFSPPDGAILASGSEDGTVRLWDVATHREMTILPYEGWGWFNSVTFSHDGATLVYSAGNGTVLLRDLETGNTARLPGHRRFFTAMALSPDGATLASGSLDGTFRLWDAATQTQVATLEGHTSRVSSVSSIAISPPDGATLASGSSDGTVRLWDMATRTYTATLAGHTRQVRSVAFSPNGALLASGSEDGTVRLWDVATQEEVATLEGHTDQVSSVSFSPDGALLASAGPGFEDKTVRLWDVETHDLVGTLELEGHERVRLVAFSPDGKTLASASVDDRIRLWDVATRARIATLREVNTIHSMVFSPDGLNLVSGLRGTVSLWDVPRKRRAATLEGHGDWVHSVAVSRDGATLATGSWDGTMLLWDMQLVLPHPRTLAKLSGDQQQGLPAAQLAEPFVVSVLDQNGAPLAGATVTFAVTAGGGSLSTTTAATDADGRAAATLTLGSQPGPNTVEATVAELEPVTFTATVLAPQSLTQVSGDEQEGPVGAALSQPFVVEVRDQNGTPFAGATVTFTVTAGGGSLSTTTATTDADGRAATTLTLGNQPETNTVTATVTDLGPVTFTAAAKATPDFDGDGEIGFSDFFLFAEAFGGTDPRFDLDGSGMVDFTDFFLFAEHFGQPVRAKLLALARERIGLPDGPQLQQNAPNPFNSETVISWFLLRPGPAQVEVFGLTGQRVAVLHKGPKKAGVHRVQWDGRDQQGRPLASGVYLYRLSTAEAVHTRKLTLLR